MMTRITVKLSTCALLMALVVCGGVVARAHGQAQNWTAIGPGVGGQVHAFAFDPGNADVAYAGGDVCGVYKYSVASNRWVPWSDGLGYNDINRTFYVDDLLVVRNAPIDDNNGVYAATQGGIWFRRDDASHWVCVSGALTYTKGYAWAALHYAYDSSRPALQRIPFAGLAYDAETGTLYAGAGSARMDGVQNFYPRTNMPQNKKPGDADILLPPQDEYSVWRMDLNSAARPMSAIAASGGYGYARQVAVAKYVDGLGSEHKVIAAACENQIFMYEPATAQSATIWPVPAADKAHRVIALDTTYSEWPWGVAAGSNGRLYAIMRRGPDAAIRPGVWEHDLATGQWTEVAGDGSDLWLPDQAPVTWVSFLINADRDDKRDLTELSVYPKASGHDEIFVGIRQVQNGVYGDCGYLRCGDYGPSQGASKYGWAYIHYNKDGIKLADWRNGVIHTSNLLDDAIGWHKFYPSLQALVPFAISPADSNRMVAIDYHIPLVSVNGGDSWTNMYTTGSDAGGWQNTGLNLLCTRSAATMPDGRLVIGAGDYGVFCGTNATNRYFRMVHKPNTTGNPLDFPDAIDVGVVNSGGHDEIYMVDEIDADDNKPATSERADVYVCIPDVAPNDWTAIAGDVDADLTTVFARNRERLEITDIAFITPERMIAAVGVPASGGGVHCFLREGARAPGSTSWEWGKVLDVDIPAGNLQTKLVTDLCAIPGTHKVMFAAKTKTYGTSAVVSDGGVYAVDWGATANDPLGQVEAWLGSGETQSDYQKLGKHVSALEVDASGRYVYVGCSRPDSAWELGRGGVVRLLLDNGNLAGREILSGADGAGNWHFPLDGRAFYTTDTNAMQCWEWCTNVTDIAIDPHDRRVCYVALNNGSYMDTDTGVWKFLNGDWEHVWGGGEVGYGAKTVDVSVNGSELYVGSIGEEFFAVPIAPMGASPVVAGNAQYPLLRNAGSSATNVFAVQVTPVQGKTVRSVTVDGNQLGSGVWPIALKDDGAAPDLVAGDGVYTSTWLQTNIGGVTELTAQVTAVGSDGNYAVTNVHVNVIAAAPAVDVADAAVYPILAGSTGHPSSFAVRITSTVPVPQALLYAPDGSGTAMRDLRDNGLDGDDVAGDGIYTSAEFVAPADWQPMVYPITFYGMTAPEGVAVTTSTNNAKFADVTASTDKLKDVLTEQPYAAVYFKSEPNAVASPEVMIVTFDNDGTAGSGQAPRILWRDRRNPGDNAPQFSDVTGDWFASGVLKRGGRGVCYADYDRDGDNDFFICNPAHGGKLFENHLNEGLGFEDVTNDVFGADAAFLAQSITAAWGDYNADSLPDLCVAATNYQASVQGLVGSAFSVNPEGGGGGGGSQINSRVWIFRNRQGRALTKTTLGGTIDNNIVLSVCWDDIEDDGDLDLITSKYIFGGFQVYENYGYDANLDDNRLVLMPWALEGTDPDQYYGTNAVSTFDYDNDGCRDLVLTYANVNENQKVKLLINNYKRTGFKTFQTFQSQPLDTGTEWNGATVADFDLNGRDDILLQPRMQGIVPALYMATEGNPADYRNVGHALGLRSGITGGAVAADFDGDKNVDLFLGRSGGAGARALYRNVAALSPSQVLAVNVHTLNRGGTVPLGTKVEFHSASRRGTKIIEGGSGRGCQSANQLLLGLGDVPGPVTVTVRYPSGEVDGPMSVTPNGEPLEVWEDQPPAFAPVGKTNPTCSYELAPGQTDWVFRWKTSVLRGDPMLDKVEVWNYLDYEPDGSCGVGIPAGGTRTLEWGMTGVEHSVRKVGTVWVHEVRWKSLPCGTNCIYKFRVTSGLGAQTITGNWYPTTTNSFCVPDPGDPNQQ